MNVRLLCRTLLPIFICTVMGLTTTTAYSQPTNSKVVSGTVNDENGASLAGVSVLIKNSTTGTTTALEPAGIKTGIVSVS